MCRLCGDPECHNGVLCGLEYYLSIREVRDAIGEVNAYDPSFTARSFRSMQYTLRRGGNRPAHSTGVWNHFTAIGDSGYTCPYCNRYLRGGHEVDHIVPWERYLRSVLGLTPNEEGDIPQFIAGVLVSDPRNLQVICSPCNASKNNKAEGDPGFYEWVASRRRWGEQQKAEEEDEEEEVITRLTPEEQRRARDKRAQDGIWKRWNRDPDSDDDSGGGAVPA